MPLNYFFNKDFIYQTLKTKTNVSGQEMHVMHDDVHQESLLFVISNEKKIAQISYNEFVK